MTIAKLDKFFEDGFTEVALEIAFQDLSADMMPGQIECRVYDPRGRTVGRLYEVFILRIGPGRTRFYATRKEADHARMLRGLPDRSKAQVRGQTFAG